MTTLPHVLKRIRLNLARSKEHPSGSPRHGYEFVAPLDATGHIDLELWRKHRDPSIKFKLGMNPFALGWHRLLAQDGFVMRICKARAQQSKLASEVLLQYHYLDGVEEGLRVLGR